MALHGATMRKLLMILIGCLVLSSPANAQETAAGETANGVLSLLEKAKISRERTHEARELLQLHIGSIGRGIFWANTYMQESSGTLMYCPPEKLVVTTQQYVDILRQHVRREPKEGDLPTGLALLRALISIYPCQN